MSQHVTTCRACGRVCSKTFCETCFGDCVDSIIVACPRCLQFTDATPRNFGGLSLKCGHDLILLSNDAWLCKDAPSIKSKEIFEPPHAHEPFTVVELPTATQTDLWKTPS